MAGVLVVCDDPDVDRSKVSDTSAMIGGGHVICTGHEATSLRK